MTAVDETFRPLNTAAACQTDNFFMKFLSRAIRVFISIANTWFFCNDFNLETLFMFKINASNVAKVLECLMTDKLTKSGCLLTDKVAKSGFFKVYGFCESRRLNETAGMVLLCGCL